jgi:hypothetical protein
LIAFRTAFDIAEQMQNLPNINIEEILEIDMLEVQKTKELIIKTSSNL